MQRSTSVQTKRARQDAVCRFARGILAARTGETIEVTARPELDNPGVPAVEELWASPTRRYAVEHTRIESYPGQIRNDARLGRLLGPVRSMLAGRLPGTFVLAVDVGEAVKARLPYAAAQHEIVRLALEAAPGLRIGEACRLQSPLLPFEIQVKCRRRRGSRLGIRCVVFGDGPALRLDRVRRAFDDKCPKLAAWAGKDAVALLILEADDIQLSNVFLVSDAVQTVIAERSDLPDVIVFVETDMSPMEGWVLKDGAHVGDAVPRPNGVRRYTEDMVRDLGSASATERRS
jgi:hypothetical protein